MPLYLEAHERGGRIVKNVLLCVALLVTLAGCASTPKLDQQAGQSDVRIDPAVVTATEMYFYGPGSAFGALGGAIGGLITAAANEGPGERLDKFAKDNGIHIDQIVQEEATKAFRDSGKLRLVDSPGAATATMKVSIAMYGFSIPNGFSALLVPILKIKCQLVGADGKVIWSANDETMPLGNPVEGSSLDALYKDPKLIEASWRAAARTIMKEIVDHM